MRGLRTTSLGCTFAYALLPLEALALDCLLPTAGQHARSLLNAGTPHVVIRGDLSYTPGQDMGETLVDGALDLRLNATINGRPVSPEGYGSPTELIVTEHHFCHEPWCNGPIDNTGVTDAFFVLRDTRNGLIFESGMCSFDYYPWAPDVEEELFACLRGEPTCTPPQW